MRKERKKKEGVKESIALNIAKMSERCHDFLFLLLPLLLSRCDVVLQHNEVI